MVDCVAFRFVFACVGGIIISHCLASRTSYSDLSSIVKTEPDQPVESETGPLSGPKELKNRSARESVNNRENQSKTG